MPMVNCSVCGAELKRPPSRSGPNVYCSPAENGTCMQIARGRPRGKRKDTGTDRSPQWVGSCDGPDCCNLVKRRASETRNSAYCGRWCFERNADRHGREGGAQNRPLGTEITDADGYVRVKVAAGSRGWKFKHVLVMEEALGRLLLRQENVHHKNGKRDDNRLENLELWSTKQPKGQRVVDKVAYAKEILALYEPEVLAAADLPPQHKEACRINLGELGASCNCGWREAFTEYATPRAVCVCHNGPYRWCRVHQVPSSDW